MCRCNMQINLAKAVAAISYQEDHLHCKLILKKCRCKDEITYLYFFISGSCARK